MTPFTLSFAFSTVVEVLPLGLLAIILTCGFILDLLPTALVAVLDVLLTGGASEVTDSWNQKVYVYEVVMGPYKKYADWEGPM